jgi:hypothetical protein
MSIGVNLEIPIDQKSPGTWFKGIQRGHQEEDMNTNRKGSFQDLNALFVFGACSVLLIHILGFFIEAQTEYPWNDDIEALAIILLRFGRSLFIFATGMLLFYWYKQKQMNWAAFWRKRWRVIVLPYTIWTAIYTVFKLQTLDPWVVLPQFAESLFTGSSFYHLYYIPLYLQLNVLFFLCKPLFERYLRFSLVTALFFLQLGVYLFYHYLFVDPIVSGIDWNAHPVLQIIQHSYVYGQNYVYMYVFHFALGAYAGLHVETWRTWVHRLRVPFGLMAVVTALWIAARYLYGHASYEESLNIFHPLYFFYTTCFLVAFYPLSAFLGKLPVLSNWLSILARHNMAIYLVHPLILFLLESHIIFRLSWSTPILIAAMFVITPPLCIFLYEHTLVSYWYRGNRPKPQKRRPLVMNTHNA